MVLDILRPCTKILFGKKQKYNPTSGNCKKKDGGRTIYIDDISCFFPYPGVLAYLSFIFILRTWLKVKQTIPCARGRKSETYNGKTIKSM